MYIDGNEQVASAGMKRTEDGRELKRLGSYFALSVSGSSVHKSHTNLKAVKQIASDVPKCLRLRCVNANCIFDSMIRGCGQR